MSRGAKLVGVVVVTLLIALTGSIAGATPNYAREEGVSCLGCHSLSSTTVIDGVESQLIETSSATYSLSQSDSSIKAGMSIFTKPVGKLFGYQTLYPDDDDNAGVEENIDVESLSGFVGNNLFKATVFMTKAPTTARPGKSAGLGKNDDSASIIYRLAYTPKLGNVGFSLGFFGESASGKENTNYAYRPETGMGRYFWGDSYGVDARINSRIGNIFLGVAAQYVTQNRGGSIDLDGATPAEITDGFKASAEIGYSRVFGLSAAYRTYKGKTVAGDETLIDNTASLGAWVTISDRLTIESQYSATISFEEDPTYNESAFTLLFLTNF